MDSHANRKDFFYVIVLILTFITVVIGMAFAIYTWIFSQKEGSSAVYTGTLTIEYLSGNIIDLNLLYPSERPNFNTTKNVYRNNFKITNTGSLDGIAEIELDVVENQFSNNTLMYILYNSSEEEVATGYLNGTEDIIIAKDIELDSNVVEEYVLVIWLNESHENQNTEMRKSLMGSINVNALQKRD